MRWARRWSSARARGRCWSRSARPRLERAATRAVAERVAPVYETVTRVATVLPAETTLIGFAGAPWTVASYMVEGGSSRDFAAVKRLGLADPGGFGALIDRLTEATIVYLRRPDRRRRRGGAALRQLGRGAAGRGVPPLGDRADAAHRRGAQGKRIRAMPMIGFPRGAGLMYRAYVTETGVDALGLDSAVPASIAPQDAAVDRAGAGQSRSGAAAGRRRASMAAVDGDAAARLGERTVHLQSRPWRHAGDAGGACGRVVARCAAASAMSRTAVVLFNLGGPDRLEAVEPFLFNLFQRSRHHRPAAAAALARGAARSRGGGPGWRRQIYRRMGGASPMLANTEAQAQALAAALGAGLTRVHRHALLAAAAADAVAAVKAWQPDEIVLLPLYPQFSTHHDGVLAGGLATDGTQRRPRRRRPGRCAAIPRRRASSRRSQAGAAALRGLAGRREAAHAVLGARLAANASWRAAIPINGKSSARWRRLRRAHGLARPGQRRLLSEPRRAAGLARARDR